MIYFPRQVGTTFKQASTLRRSRSIHLGLLLTALGAAFVATASPVRAQTSGDNGSHDPSRMIESNGRVYIYSTGGGGKSSADGLVWKNEATPPWNRSAVSGNQGIWAPDGLFLNGKYLLFGSMWSSAKASALILLTTPSLDPAQAKWTDGGTVVAGPAGVTHSCIDPAPVLDAKGDLWVVWGGGYPFDSSANSIFVTRLDNDTGLPITTDPGYKPPNSPGYPIEQGHKEGSYIHYHNNYYYLWYQTGGCCSGTASTYEMHVARASAITGPYSGDRVFYASNGNIHGPGHIGIYTCGTVERFSYHYYPDNGSVIGVNTLTWGSDGWPVAGAQVSTGLKLPCDQMTVTPPPTDGGVSSTGGTSGGRDGGAAGGSSGGASGGTATDAGASGGTQGSGGAPVDPGTGGRIASTGGSTASTGGSSPTSSGGSTGSGGQNSTGGTPGTTDSSSGGCACAVRSGREPGGSLGIMLVVGIALAAARRKRRR